MTRRIYPPKAREWQVAVLSTLHSTVSLQREAKRQGALLPDWQNRSVVSET